MRTHVAFSEDAVRMQGVLTPSRAGLRVRGAGSREGSREQGAEQRIFWLGRSIQEPTVTREAAIGLGDPSGK